ncbi:unnamed protein product [Rotaria sordida]|uniref:Uncharacterized protein n=1 Tax=Rotaria sordida TaxID=392033 RepID=A0A818VY86_9BILA|nr:unnamed protein product [Rotaria sordida]CAF1075907.1 unnamed protein product [Rotaria sordida]CAF3717400.1 unnamed protein product [Rotaria sordida]CAF3827789.1 unnamed protein product [Rotaria sordida]
MAIVSSRSTSPRIDSFSRILIITATFFSIAALTLLIVGIATRSWYYNKDSNGNIEYYNLFTQCKGNENNRTSICIDMQRQTDLGLGTQHAAALLVVAICLLGCGTLVILAMNFVQLTGILVLIAPILLFLATLFMVAALAEGSKVSIFNSYSVNLVQTGHVLTIFSMGIIAFASGRLHIRYYGQF